MTEFERMTDEVIVQLESDIQSGIGNKHQPASSTTGAMLAKEFGCSVSEYGLQPELWRATRQDAEDPDACFA